MQNQAQLFQDDSNVVRVTCPPWLPADLREQLAERGEIVHVTSFSKAERRILRKRKRIKVSEWSEKHRYLTMSSIPGVWRNEVTPYLTGIMDAAIFPSVRTIIVCKAPQVGMSEGAHNFVGYVIDRAPGPVLYVYPDERTARENSTDRILPMITSSPRLRSYMTRVQDDTSVLRINLQHMPIYLAWARSASRLANKPIRYLVFDETDKYPEATGKRESDPISLGEKRTRTYQWNRVIWKISSPTTETGYIWKALQTEAQVIFYFWVCCPYCVQYQVMEFDQIKFPKDERDPETMEQKKLAWYECKHCEKSWDDAARNKAVRNGHWRAAGLEDSHMGLELFAYLKTYRPTKIGFHLPAWLSYFVSLSEVAGAFLKGRSDFQKLKDFMNGYKAEPWRQTLITTAQEEVLKARCDLAPQTVPAEAVALTAGIDVQKYGFWFVVRAWAVDYTSWLIHYGQLAAWEDVERLLFDTTYPIVKPEADGEGAAAGDGRVARIMRAAIDTGGGDKDFGLSMTEETYWWLRQNAVGRGCRVFGTKGASRSLAGKVHMTKPIDKTPSGKALPGGLQILQLDTNDIKDMFFYRLNQAMEHGAQAAYLHAETDQVYATHITAEEKERDEKGIERWIQKKARNDLLDCECLAHICADPEWPGGGIHLFKSPAPAEKKAPPAKPAGSGWATRGRDGGWMER